MGRRRATAWLVVLAVVLGAYGVSRTWDRGTWDARAPEGPRPAVPAASISVVRDVPLPEPCDSGACPGGRPGSAILCVGIDRVIGGPPEPVTPTAAPQSASVHTVARSCGLTTELRAELRGVQP